MPVLKLQFSEADTRLQDCQQPSLQSYENSAGLAGNEGIWEIVYSLLLFTRKNHYPKSENPLHDGVE